MQRIYEAYNKYNEYGRFIGATYNVIQPGEVEYFLKVKKEFLATATAVHGGLLAGFSDAVLGVAALSTAVENECVVSTLELKISFLNPVFAGDELRGVGKVLKKGKRIIFSEAQIFNQNNLLLACASGTFNAYLFEKSDMVKLL